MKRGPVESLAGIALGMRGSPQPKKGPPRKMSSSTVDRI